MAAPLDERAARRATNSVGRLLLRVVRGHAPALDDGPLVLAVSGGADSLAMLFAAVNVRRALGRELVVAHFSHGIRKRAEQGEAALVRRVARRFDLTLAHEQGAAGSAEASAREARYAFLSRVASTHGASAVLTAHTQDDQAETLLLRLTRGTGLRGAGAIRELSQRTIAGERLTLLRPLLAASRGATQSVCAEWEVTPASDGSNRSVRYARNRVRRRVLGELAQINPDVRGSLAAFAEQAQADEALLAQYARDAVAGDERRGRDDVRWSTRTLAGLPAPLLARVLQAAWASLRGEGVVLARTRINAIGRIIKGRTGLVELTGGGTVMVEQDLVTMRSTGVTATVFAAVDLAIPGAVIVSDWQVTAQPVAGAQDDGDAWRVALDADAVGVGVCVRPRARGDRFQPLGMPTEVRLQDVLVNAKVPRSLRDGLPLVVGDRGIAWVPGVRIAEWAKVTPETRRVVAFEVRSLVDGLGF
jgi:tRNA(Ile)-lysidine synthase